MASSSHPIERQGEKLRWLLFAVALLLLGAGVYLVVKPFVEPFLWAVVLVVTAWPLYARLMKAIPGWPRAAALLMTVLIAVVIVSAVLPLLIVVSDQAQAALENMRPYLDARRLELPYGIRSLPLVGRAIEGRFRELRGRDDGAEDFARENAASLLRVFGVATRGAIDFIFKSFVCLLSIYLLFLNGHELARQLLTVMSEVGGERLENLVYQIRATTRAAVHGALVTAGAQGLLAGIGFVAAGAPFPVFLAFATMVFSLIPFGTPLIYLPVLIYLFISGQVLTGALLSAWCVGVVSLADNVLRPILISRATRSPLFLTFFGALGGILAFGAIGLFVGPALLATAQSLWSAWVEREW